MWITTNCEKSLKRWKTIPAYQPPKKRVQVKKQQLEPGMEQQIGSNLGKEYVKAV